MVMCITRRSLLTLLLIACWAAVLGAGLVVLLQYETAPGLVGRSVERWPADSRLSLHPDRPTLVMFAHPRCPCTRASIEELARLMAQCRRPITAHVLFYRPSEGSEDWGRTDLWWSAAAIPGVQVSSDPDGEEARRFGAMTSGHAVLYAPGGERLYSGGITGSRGHAGENVGRSTLLALVNGEEADAKQFPVFGCALFKPSYTNPVTLSDSPSPTRGEGEKPDSLIGYLKQSSARRTVHATIGEGLDQPGADRASGGGAF